MTLPAFNTITLNIPYDLPDSEWGKVMVVYKGMDGWVDGESVPTWLFPNGQGIISASAEPSGVLIEGECDPSYFLSWMSVLCSRLTLRLGREIRNADY